MAVKTLKKNHPLVLKAFAEDDELKRLYASLESAKEKQRERADEILKAVRALRKKATKVRMERRNLLLKIMHIEDEADTMMLRSCKIRAQTFASIHHSIKVRKMCIAYSVAIEESERKRAELAQSIELSKDEVERVSLPPMFKPQ